MLQTNLTHINTDEELQAAIKDNEKLMVACGRMGPMCIPVYDIMEGLEKERTDVTFRDMSFDTPVANAIRSLPHVRHFQSLPFVVYYKNGEVAKVTGGIQNKQQVTAALDEAFGQ